MLLVIVFIVVILGVILALRAYAEYQDREDISIIEEKTRQIKEDNKER